MRKESSSETKPYKQYFIYANGIWFGRLCSSTTPLPYILISFLNIYESTCICLVQKIRLRIRLLFSPTNWFIWLSRMTFCHSIHSIGFKAVWKLSSSSSPSIPNASTLNCNAFYGEECGNREMECRGWFMVNMWCVKCVNDISYK